MTDYRYIFGTMRDEKTVAEIPLYGTYCDMELNVGGRFDGSFNLDQTGKANQDMLDATIPGRSFLVVLREQKPIWGGYVWSRTYQSQSKSMQLFANSWDVWPGTQLARSDIDVTGEQRVLFANLWTEAQSVYGRNINIIVPDIASFPTVVTKSLSVLATDLRFYAELMSELADASDGFDWTIDIQQDGGNFQKILRIGYPTLGTTNPAGLTFEYPGSILNYYATESMTSAGTNVFTVGSGSGSEGLSQETTQNVMIDQGFPRWDVVASRKDISSANLTTYAVQEGLSRRPPMLTVKPSVKGNKQPSFGSFGLGDACTVALKDPRFPDGLQFNSRVIKWTLNPQSADNTEEYTVLFSHEGDDN